MIATLYNLAIRYDKYLICIFYGLKPMRNDKKGLVFAFLTEDEKKRLISSWSDKYIENEDNDSNTMHMLISLLESPKKNPDWKLACNYMKLLAVCLATKKIFIRENYDAMIDSLIGQITDILYD